jgi:hypothetical protein
MPTTPESVTRLQSRLRNRLLPKATATGSSPSLCRAEVQDILDTQGSTAVTCQFCSTRHEATFHDLIELLEALGATPRN